MRIGRVSALFRKTALGKPMEKISISNSLAVDPAAGVLGGAYFPDIMANGPSLTPRQLLLVGAPDLAHFGLQQSAMRENVVVEIDDKKIEKLTDVLKSGSEVHISRCGSAGGGSSSGASAGDRQTGSGATSASRTTDWSGGALTLSGTADCGKGTISSIVGSLSSLLFGDTIFAPNKSSSASKNSPFHEDQQPNPVLRITFPCEPCGHLIDTIKRENPARKIPTLKELNGRRGMLATVVCGGHIRVGDELCVVTSSSTAISSAKNDSDSNLKNLAEKSGFVSVVEENRGASIPIPVPAILYEPFSDAPKERFLAILKKVPTGRVILIKQLLVYAGVDPGFARALPAIVKNPQFRAEKTIKRLVYSNGELFSIKAIPDQKAFLEREGVELQRKSGVDEKNKNITSDSWIVCDLDKALWRPTRVDLFLQRC